MDKKEVMQQLKLMGLYTKDADPDLKYREFIKKYGYPKTKEQAKALIEKAKKEGIDPDYIKGMERGLNTWDDDATEHGSIEELGKNKKTESMPLEKDPTLAQDDKFATVMKEFYAGKLKSSSGEKVTDPQQAKAIAYSESKDCGPVFTKGTKDSSEDELKLRIQQLEHERNVDGSVLGYKPDTRKDKLIEQLKKQLKEMQEKRRTQDSMEVLRLCGFATDADENWITMKGTHVKIEGGQSKGEAAKKFIKKKGGDPAPAKSTKAAKQESTGKVNKEQRKELAKQYKEGHWVKTESGEIAKIDQIGTDYSDIVVEKADGSLGSLSWEGLAKSQRVGKEDIKAAKSKANEGKSSGQLGSEKEHKKMSSLESTIRSTTKSKEQREEAFNKLQENLSKMKEDVKSGKLSEEANKTINYYETKIKNGTLTPYMPWEKEYKKPSFKNS